MLFGALRASAVPLAKAGTVFLGSAAAATFCTSSVAMASKNLTKDGVTDPKKAKNIFAFNAVDIDGKDVDLEA